MGRFLYEAQSICGCCHTCIETHRCEVVEREENVDENEHRSTDSGHNNEGMGKKRWGDEGPKKKKKKLIPVAFRICMFPTTPNLGNRGVRKAGRQTKQRREREERVIVPSSNYSALGRARHIKWSHSFLLIPFRFHLSLQISPTPHSSLPFSTSPSPPSPIHNQTCLFVLLHRPSSPPPCVPPMSAPWPPNQKVTRKDASQPHLIKLNHSHFLLVRTRTLVT